MKVYIVISNGDVNGELEGVFAKREDAQACLDEIKQSWQDWGEGCRIEEDDEDGYYGITNLDYDESLEVMIKEATIK